MTWGAQKTWQKFFFSLLALFPATDLANQKCLLDETNNLLKHTVNKRIEILPLVTEMQGHWIARSTRPKLLRTFAALPEQNSNCQGSHSTPTVMQVNSIMRIKDGALTVTIASEFCLPCVPNQVVKTTYLKHTVKYLLKAHFKVWTNRKQSA